jgi:hypothetical protein
MHTMDNKSLIQLGKISGIGGIAVGGLILIFPKILELPLWSAGLTSSQTYCIVLAMMMLTFGMAP